MHLHSADTIFAPATGLAKAGVAVLRVSGPRAWECLSALGISPLPSPRRATLATLTDPATGEAIDSALILTFEAPHSFTGERVVELHTHGSRVVTSRLIAALSALPGYRLAQPGEFTRRAFVNGKMDLTQAEGIADLIDAETEAQARQALRQMRGDTGKALEALRNALIHALAMLEAYIDFPEEEIPESALAAAGDAVASVRARITRMLDDQQRGERLREGIEVVLIGPPNAGKSSLLNAIARRDVAIVSATPGTTRDMIEVRVDLQGYPVTFIDTAGLQETTDAIESEGIARAQKRAEQAELVLLLSDITTNPEQSSYYKAETSDNTLLVRTKRDLLSSPPPANIAAVSAHTGEGITELLGEIGSIISSRYACSESATITRARHREALTQALTHVERFSLCLPLELACEELRLSARSLASITGAIGVEDVLDVVFSSFCIGK